MKDFDVRSPDGSGGFYRVAYIARKSTPIRHQTTTAAVPIKAKSPGMDEPKTFPVAVTLNYAGGCSKSEAVKKAVREYPDLHREYLDLLKSGGRDSLSVLIQAHDDGLKRQWKASPDLQKEFRSADSYVAYERARREGRIGRGTGRR